ncbi:DUF732 domain-containing protein [Actinoplanes sp. CA-252034]|uniref:DUF732 domain-containing protein n=1 Tax=Actinoplanes sp. CA-252034 TaxID=3239906 RepID=UPI003D97FCF8
MRASRIWAVGVVAAISTLVGCAGREPATATATASTAVSTAVSTAASSRGSAFLEPGLRFSEDGLKAFREELAKLDSRLATDGDALAHGMSICHDILRSKTEAEVLRNAAARFKVDETVAQQIVAAARTSLCAGS